MAIRNIFTGFSLPSVIKTTFFPVQKKGIKKKRILLSKRQCFVLSVLFLSGGLFLMQNFFTGYIFLISLVFAFVTDLLLFLSIYEDIKNKMHIHVFILPFLYSFSFALFYFLVPSRLLARGMLTSFYAVGLYSLFLSENIFTVSAIRTIALLNGARIVSFLLSLISYFFLNNIIFSFHFGLLPTIGLLTISTFFLLFHMIWAYTLDTSWRANIVYVWPLALILLEVSAALWFWPTRPTVISLFLTALFYIFVGLSHIFIEKRLFRNIIWEYVWVGTIAFFMLCLLTRWRG